MAKGDDGRVRNQIDQQGGVAQNHLDNLRNDMVIPQAQDASNNYKNASERSFQDYDKLMGGYDKFAKTGGYSPTDISNIRARSVAPIRSIYAGANREVDRSKSLQGGYSPGYSTLKARMAREQSSGLSDATTNAEAGIAQLVNSGKQFGLSGGSSQFSANPGLASHFGGMQNSTMGNWLQTQGLQNQLGLGIMGAQQNAAAIPGAWQQGFNNVLDAGRVVTGAIGSGAIGGGKKP